MGELRTLAARRDEAAFAKQSAYGALRMSTRLAARAESADFSGPAGPSYVRRKANPGKGEDTPPPRP